MRTRTGADLGVLIVVIVATALVAIGSFGTWATFGPLRASGLEGGRDGWVTLVVAAAAGITIWRYYVRPRRAQAAWLIVQGASAVAVGAYDAQDISSTQVQVFGSTVGPEVGWGIWLVIVAGAVLALAGIVLFRDKRARNAERPRPEPGASGRGGTEATPFD
jgi:hypothetical protein